MDAGASCAKTACVKPAHTIKFTNVELILTSPALKRELHRELQNAGILSAGDQSEGLRGS